MTLVKERYFVTICGSVNDVGESPVDVVYQLLTRTDLDDDHVVGAHRIRHGLNKGSVCMLNTNKQTKWHYFPYQRIRWSNYTIDTYKYIFNK